MSRPKRYRWECQQCGKAKLGSSRPRANSSVRYCFPCSERTGFLVETSSPVLKRRSEAMSVRASEKRAAKSAREAEKVTRAGIHVPNEVARICRLIQLRKPSVVVRKRRSGATGVSQKGRVVMSISQRATEAEVRAIIAHELAHEVAWDGHGPRWRREFLRICRVAWNADPGDPGGSSHDLHRHVERALTPPPSSL